MLKTLLFRKGSFFFLVSLLHNSKKIYKTQRAAAKCCALRKPLKFICKGLLFMKVLQHQKRKNCQVWNLYLVPSYHVHALPTFVVIVKFNQLHFKALSKMQLLKLHKFWKEENFRIIYMQCLQESSEQNEQSIFQSILKFSFRSNT